MPLMSLLSHGTDVVSSINSCIANEYQKASFGISARGINAQLDQAQLFQRHNYHIAWTTTVREEVRDVMTVFVGRMNNNIIVDVLLLGAVAGFICEGAVDENCPRFVEYAFQMSMFVSALYLTVSLLLAVNGIDKCYAASMVFLGFALPNAPPSYDHPYYRQVPTHPLCSTSLMQNHPRMARSTSQPMGAPLGTGYLDRVGYYLSGQSDLARDDIEAPAPVQDEIGPSKYFEDLREFMKKWESFAEGSKKMMIYGLLSFFVGCGYFTLGKLYSNEDPHDYENRVSFVFLMVFVIVASGMALMLSTLVENDSEGSGELGRYEIAVRVASRGFVPVSCGFLGSMCGLIAVIQNDDRLWVAACFFFHMCRYIWFSRLDYYEGMNDTDIEQRSGGQGDTDRENFHPVLPAGAESGKQPAQSMESTPSNCCPQPGDVSSGCFPASTPPAARRTGPSTLAQVSLTDADVSRKLQDLAKNSSLIHRWIVRITVVTDSVAAVSWLILFLVGPNW